MNPFIRQLVRERAADCCEYCRLATRQLGLRMFQIEHIIAVQHRGGDEPDNLAFACRQCNLHKGPNLSGIDPDTLQIERLFHPRRDLWNEHFGFDGPVIIGTSTVGRTTVWVLQMNTEDRVELRSMLLDLEDLF